MDFQRPIVYGKISLKGEQAPRFRDVYPLVEIPDVQGGAKRLQENNTLNKFTGCCGQSIFRGTGLPYDFSGDLIIPEPVGRLIRRAKVTNDQGRVVVSNAYENQEFIAAGDPNFRPVNSATGPDGCLYIVDMYRGIIQEGNWVREGSYLRKVVQEYELEKNIGRGRIFRVDHETTERGPQPRMLDETPRQLVGHLSHPNGWWRSEAQKLLVLHNDKSVASTLRELAQNGESPLGRLHALWTLDGLDSIDAQLLAKTMADTDPIVRAAAIRISEDFIDSDRALDKAIAKLANDADPNVLIQVILSVSRGGHPDAKSLVENIVLANSNNTAITSIAQQLRARIEAMLAEKAKLAEMRRRNQALAESVVRGKVTYNTLCTTCHGENGKGKADEDGLLLAPTLVGSERVLGHKERLNRILINGLMGPIDNKTYSAGIMLPMGANSDDWIADVANYIRNEWGNEGGLIETSDVARVRSEAKSHVGPWTLKELAFFDPPPMENRQAWKLTSNFNSEHLNNAIDGDPQTRWDTGKTQKPGMWMAVEFPEPIKVLSLTLDTSGSAQDYPRRYEIQFSEDGKNWGKAAAKGKPSNSPITKIELDGPPIRHLKVTQTGSSRNKYWSIHELQIKGLTARDKPPAPLTESLMKIDAKQLAAEAIEFGDASRGAAIFFNPALSCAKCHEPNSGERLGPDLASKRDGVSHPFVVDSILSPSKSIRDDFNQTMVLTIEGQVISGFLVSEDDEKMVIREPAGGKEIAIAIDDVEDTKLSKVSAMPAGLVNQLEDKQQFLDLINFLFEVNENREEFDALKPKN